MNNNLLVSVIIPLYNTEKYIKECLESIVNQTYHNLEIIVINDCSTDKSVDVVNKYFSNDKRINLISLKKNMGLANARKTGIKNSHGDYLMFIDADDWLDLDTIQICIDNIIQNKVDVVRYGMVRELVEEKRKVNFEVPFSQKKIIKREEFSKELYPFIFKTYTFNSLCSQVIKRELLNENMVDDEIITGEDLYCNIKILDKIKSICFIPKYYYHYRFNTNSITGKTTKKNIWKKVDDVIKVYSVFFYYVEKWNMKEEYEKTVALRVLNEITNQFYYIFLAKDITKKDINELIERIFNDASIDLIIWIYK